MADKKRISDALMRIRDIQDRNKRDLYLSELERQLGQTLVAPRYPDTVHDVWSLVSALQDNPDAMRFFVWIIRNFHGGVAAIVELEQLLDQMYPGRFLGAEHQTRLELLMGQVPVSNVEAAFQHAFSPVPTGAAPRWTGSRLALQRVDLVSNDENSMPCILIFADVLAHGADSPTSLGLHRWIDTVGGALGLSQHDLRGICLGRLSRPGADRLTALSSADTARAGLPHVSTSPPQDAGITAALAAGPAAASSVGFDQMGAGHIWRRVPNRNSAFTGRQRLMSELRAALARWQTVILSGQGGVGKTQLATEYVHRSVGRYDLVWWMDADRGDRTAASLAALGKRLGVPADDDDQAVTSPVLDFLSAGRLRWLLVYDNAVQPEDLAGLIPSAGGHVIVTARSEAWTAAGIGHAIEVDVFGRDESVELLGKRVTGITPEHADQLADKLGDLPLALDQAGTWLATTRMPVEEYLDDFDSNIEELMSEAKPISYHTPVYALLRMAFDKLRKDAPGAAQLLDLFAFLGPEPLSVELLRADWLPDPETPLAKALRDRISKGRVIRELSRFGLAKVDPSGKNIQVHRLVQLVLRDSLPANHRDNALANVRGLLAMANPGEPDKQSNWPVYEQIGPHMEAASLIGAPNLAARQLVLDYARFLFRRGDYNPSRALSERAFTEWSKSPELGPDDVQTLGASGWLSNALHLLGDNKRAQELAEDAFSRLRRNPDIGEDHEYTLQAADRVALSMRVVGQFAKARELDEENLERHLRVYDEAHPYTQAIRSNLAVSLRMLGEFAKAYEIDAALAARWQNVDGEEERALFSLANVARDLYGLGRYAEALETQRLVLPMYAQLLRPRHHDVLLCHRTEAVALRKTGRYADALLLSERTYRRFRSVFGPDHEHTLAAGMSYANALRSMERFEDAHECASAAVDRYLRHFGDQHPLTLAARVNLAIILRHTADLAAARELSERTMDSMRRVLGLRHPFTLCSETAHANDLAACGERAPAYRLSRQTHWLSREVNGASHPYTLACAINNAFDAQARGRSKSAQVLFEESAAKLSELLGAEHPEVLDAKRGRRAECDIEPPPT